MELDEKNSVLQNISYCVHSECILSKCKYFLQYFFLQSYLFIVFLCLAILQGKEDFGYIFEFEFKGNLTNEVVELIPINALEILTAEIIPVLTMQYR